MKIIIIILILVMLIFINYYIAVDNRVVEKYNIQPYNFMNEYSPAERKNIICILTVRPCIKTYNFIKELKLKSDYEVFIVIDDNKYDIPNYDGVVKVIKIKNEESESIGYKNTILWLNGRAGSRDKALYYFNRYYTNYDNIWFLEDDVFIPRINTIKDIDNKYIEGDLLTSDHEIVYEKRYDWHWVLVQNHIKIDLPYAKSMICAIRCSRKMMICIDDYVKKYNNLFLDEALFNTIALHNELDVKAIPELSTIHWKKDWVLEDIKKTNLYHPIKDIQQQYDFRKNIL
jgi:hypothetical protein